MKTLIAAVILALVPMAAHAEEPYTYYQLGAWARAAPDDTMPSVTMTHGEIYALSAASAASGVACTGTTSYGTQSTAIGDWLMSAPDANTKPADLQEEVTVVINVLKKLYPCK